MIAEPDSIAVATADAHWAEMVDSALQEGRVTADARERRLLVQTLRRCGELGLPLTGTKVQSELELAVDFTRVLQGLIRE